MPYLGYAKMFVDSNGTPKAGFQVLESCIDSSEYIIRQIAKNAARLTRKNTGPDIIAEFANWEFNASTEYFLNAEFP